MVLEFCGIVRLFTNPKEVSLSYIVLLIFKLWCFLNFAELFGCYKVKLTSESLGHLSRSLEVTTTTPTSSRGLKVQ
jgi:hypothetical protein